MSLRHRARMSGYEKSPDYGAGQPVNWRRVVVGLCWIAVFAGAAFAVIEQRDNGGGHGVRRVGFEVMTGMLNGQPLDADAR